MCVCVCVCMCVFSLRSLQCIVGLPSWLDVASRRYLRKRGSSIIMTVISVFFFRLSISHSSSHLYSLALYLHASQMCCWTSDWVDTCLCSPPERWDSCILITDVCVCVCVWIYSLSPEAKSCTRIMWKEIHECIQWKRVCCSYIFDLDYMSLYPNFIS